MNEKSLKLAGDGLEAARELAQLKSEVDAKRADMKSRFDQEWAEFCVSHQRRSDAVFARIYDSAGVQPGDGYSVDTEYLDEHGFAFLLRDVRQGEIELLGELAQAASAVGATVN